MLRSISTTVLVAALVMSGPVLGAQTRSGGGPTVPGGGRVAAPAKAKAAAPVPVTPADMASMLGAWTIPLETPTGRLVADLVFRVEAGKVVAGISAPQLAEEKIADITKSGQVLMLKASVNYRGALTAYSGPVTMVLTLRPRGADLAAWFDFNNAGYQIGGTAKKKPEERP
jgi:hypothetical protein